MEIELADTSLSQRTAGFHTGSGSNSEFVEFEMDRELIDVEVTLDMVRDYPPIDIFETKPLNSEFMKHSSHRLAEGI